MISRYIALVLTICLFLSLATRIAEAQSVYGLISGSFSDPSGAPVIGAKITVTSIEKGSKFTSRTNQSGYFVITHLLPDNYSLKVEAEGFKTYQDPAVPVSADYTSHMEVKLARGDVKEITSGGPGDLSILKLDRTDVATILTRKYVESLPVRDLNITRLEFLSPGALPTKTFLSHVQNPQGGTLISVNGQHFSGTAFQLDGSDNRDPLEALIVTNPTLESVGEMKLTSQNYGSEFGEATGGVLSIQTRSGTNAFHGTLFDYRRTDWGQTENPFSTVGIAPTKRNEFGGSLSGPMLRNRLFFFTDYEGTRDSEGFNQVLSVPTNRVHQTCTGPGSSLPNCDLTEYVSRLLIPNSQVSPQAVQLLNLLKAPNRSGALNNFEASGAEVFDSDLFNVREDLNLTNRLKLFGRYSFADFRDSGTPVYGVEGGGAGTNQQGFAGNARTRNQSMSFGFAYSLSSTLLTDFRFGFFRYHLNLDSPDVGTAPVTQLIPGLNIDFFSSGLPDLELPGQIKGQLPNDSLGSDYLRFGYSPQVNSCNCPLRERENQFQWVNNWTKTLGNHEAKWGADIRYIQNYRLASDRRRAGHLTFGTGLSPSGLSLETFLRGEVTEIDRYFDNTSNPAHVNAGERQKRAFFYAQDNWKLNSRLTLNYGLRWEVYFPQSVTGSGAGGFLIPDFSNPTASVFNVPGTPGVGPDGGVKTSWHNFGPRIGLAYLVKSNTVVRAGYSRSFDVGFAGSIFGIAATQNPPVMVSLQTLSSPNSSGPLFQLGQNAPSFTFPSFTSSFSISQFLNALTAGNAQNQAVVYALPRTLRLPTVDAWNVTVQHQLSARTYFELAYVGNKGTHVLTDSSDNSAYYNLNQATISGFITAFGSNPSVCSSTPKAGANYCITQTATRSFFRTPTLLTPQAVRYFGNNASNNYNALQTKVEKRFGAGYSVLAHYTWAKGLDYDGNYFRVNPRIGYGPANFDRRHSFVLANLWSLPIGRGHALFGKVGSVADRIVGGWGINAVTVWRSGTPFTPSYSKCNSDEDVGVCRPNLVGTVAVTGSRNGYFTPAGTTPAGTPLTAGTFDPVSGVTTPGQTAGPWQRPAKGSLGNVSRNFLRGPGFFESDISVAKEIPVTERVTLRFRADVFNAFNKVNLGTPVTTVDSGNAGKIQGLDPSALPREYQFSLKMQF